jgi:hypothetical protein
LPSLSVLVTCRVFDAMSAIFFHTGSTCLPRRSSFVGGVYYRLALNMLNGLAPSFSMPRRFAWKKHTHSSRHRWRKPRHAHRAGHNVLLSDAIVERAEAFLSSDTAVGAVAARVALVERVPAT